MATLKAEFRDWVQGVLDDLEDMISKLRCQADVSEEELGEIYMAFAREVHSIKGASGSYGFGTIANISHRLEDYLSATRMKLQDELTLDDTLVFLDQIRELAGLDEDPQGDQALAFLKKLPSASVRGTSATNEEPANRLEALIISPSKTVAAISTSVFEKCGIHVVRTQTGAEGIALAIKSRPDIILTSMYLDDISGAEVLSAISAIKPIQNSLKVLSTSLKRPHPELNDLDKDIQVIKSDISMANQLNRLTAQVVGK